MPFTGRFILWQYDFVKPVKDHSGENSERKAERHRAASAVSETTNHVMAEVRTPTATLETPLVAQWLRLDRESGNWLLRASVKIEDPTCVTKIQHSK